MKIFSAAQIRSWDQFTISEESLPSVDLMERAATACAEWIHSHFSKKTDFLVISGKGNNGGDGLAIARLLSHKNRKVQVWITDLGQTPTPDFQTNFDRIKKSGIHYRDNPLLSDLAGLSRATVLIDALFGSGLNRPLEGEASRWVTGMNETGKTIVSIDLPSGLFPDQPSTGNPVMRAGYTLCFQAPKPAFMMPENAGFTGKMVILDIGLHPAFSAKETSSWIYIEKRDIQSIIKPRPLFSHKGDYGHAGLFAGSRGMMGAAFLAAKACLRSGAGKVTALIPACGLDILQTSLPELICRPDSHPDFLEVLPALSEYTAIGMGPGIGREPQTEKLMSNLLNAYRKPMVLDADALNLLAAKPELLKSIPPNSILTPHPGEFRRLFGSSVNDFEQTKLLLGKASQYQVYIVLKGFRTRIACPDGILYFNSSGNPGMATAGSGDVLTGMLTGFLAQGYSSLNSCLAGVYLHGLAGDLAATELSEPSLIAGDLIDYLAAAFRSLASANQMD